MAHLFNMKAIDCSLMRGGSSKGVFVAPSSFSADPALRDREILALMGSPDLRQIDGLGGGDRLTSKLAIVGASTRDDCDIDYHVAQADPRNDIVDWSRNCGNLTAAAALQAIYRGHVAVTEAAGTAGRMSVRIHQRNTHRRIIAHVGLQDGAPAVEGPFAMGGVPGTGARIDLDFSDFTGSAVDCGLFPTGQVADRISLPDDVAQTVTILDFANLHVIVPQHDLPLRLAQGGGQLAADQRLLDRLQAIEAAAMQRVRSQTGQVRPVPRPILYLVAAASDHLSADGMVQPARGHDIMSRSNANGLFSKAHPVTGALALAIAHRIAGTVVADMPTPAEPEGTRIAHAGGVLTAQARVEGGGASAMVHGALIGRTARLLFEGRAFIRR